MRPNEIHLFGGITPCTAAHLRAVVKARPVEVICEPGAPYRDQPKSDMPQTVIVQHVDVLVFVDMFGSGREFLCLTCGEVQARGKA